MRACILLECAGLKLKRGEALTGRTMAKEVRGCQRKMEVGRKKVEYIHVLVVSPLNISVAYTLILDST